ncbi:hypothetical protein VN97_g7568 [Penicillium thymicola]|uniref:Tat pathway signal sequence n=1 Tax=Penicillium thymicola TaxID=293382 RepID=A0AAI9TEA5_PENTH|nr:hypothetical protein VN97_g7568 [Penicillium thymicola]
MKLELPKRWSKTKYFQLGSSDSESENDIKSSPETSPRPSNLRKAIPWLAHLVLVCIPATLLLGAIQIRKQTIGPLFAREYETAVQTCGLKTPLELSGEFGARSAWRGGGNTDVDAAWESLELNSAMSVSRHEIEKIKKLRNSSVVLPDGGYMASIGGFHQMHCLNVIRKATYLDYYTIHEPDFFTEPSARKHVDHCIEMLRQILMCSADMHLITCCGGLRPHIGASGINTQDCSYLAVSPLP